MITTHELRWFKPGKPQAEVIDWFSNNCPGKSLGDAEERLDWYLLPASPCDYLNIKLRQGRLEVKWRKAQFDTLSFGKTWSGNVEKWVKWSCEDPTADSFSRNASMLEEGAWIRVKKIRSLRQVSDCQIELAQLMLQDTSWWSLAFEIEGVDSSLRWSLQSIASDVSQTYSGTPLQADDSFAYPYWLSLRE